MSSAISFDLPGLRRDAIAKFDYDKQQDDEISLRTGDVLVNVCRVYIYTIVYFTAPFSSFFPGRGGLVQGNSQRSHWYVP